jgi:hypothetical protein
MVEATDINGNKSIETGDKVFSVFADREQKKKAK